MKEELTKIIVIVDSEGYSDGCESNVVYGEHMLEDAYADYTESFALLKQKDEETDFNDTPKLSYEDFVREVENNPCVFIQGDSSHIQYELKVLR